jgi:hypothetical protein
MKDSTENKDQINDLESILGPLMMSEAKLSHDVLDDLFELDLDACEPDDIDKKKILQ